MGRVRVERISLRDERSHSEGISLASERSAPRTTTSPLEKSLDLNEDLLWQDSKKNKEQKKDLPASSI